MIFRTFFKTALAYSGILLLITTVLFYWYSQDMNVTSMTRFSHRSTDDFGTRSKFQQKQVDIYCQKNPNITYDSRRLLNAQLLSNNEHKVFFCLVEKNGNTNVRLLFLIAAGLVPESSSSLTRKQIQDLIHTHNQKIIAGENNNHSTIYSLLPDYFKMMMVRNPLERLLSVYRDKLQGPIKRIKFTDVDDEYSNTLKLAVLEAVKQDEYLQWLQNDTLTHQISFSDFIQFVVDEPNDELNPHYQPVIHLCHPCSIKYDFYGAFKMFNKDIQILVDKLGAKPKHISSTGYNDKMKTANLLKNFYSELSQNLKEELFRDWYSELEFYYHLYPEERNSHKALLNINEDIPIDFEQ